jgi:hypothetical protein
MREREREREREKRKERCLIMLRAWVVSGGKRTNSYLIV